MRLHFSNSFGGVASACKVAEGQRDAFFIVEPDRLACSELKLERQLHRARPANLVERVQAAIGPA